MQLPALDRGHDLLGEDHFDWVAKQHYGFLIEEARQRNFDRCRPYRIADVHIDVECLPCSRQQRQQPNAYASVDFLFADRLGFHGCQVESEAIVDVGRQYNAATPMMS